LKRRRRRYSAERLYVMHAALINGISSHVFDFDDTDLTAAVLPSPPVLPVLLALAEQQVVATLEDVGEIGRAGAVS
jgi:2-methylcitrate dehydratase PrpD